MSAFGTRLSGEEKMPKTYKSFYHLHTPWTGGRWVRENVLTFLVPYIKEAGIEVFNEWPIEDTRAHSCWHPKIDDDTYIVSTFRDPLFHFASLFFHLSVADQGQTYPNPITYNKEKFTQEYMYRVLFGEEGPQTQYLMDNFQSKNLLYTSPLIDTKNIRVYIDPIKSINEVLIRAKRIDLLVKTERLPKNPMLMVKKIVEDLNLPLDTVDKVNNEYLNKVSYLDNFNKLTTTPETKTFAEKMDTSQMKYRIRADLHIYSIEELFYSFNE